MNPSDNLLWEIDDQADGYSFPLAFVRGTREQATRYAKTLIGAEKIKPFTIVDLNDQSISDAENISMRKAALLAERKRLDEELKKLDKDYPKISYGGRNVA